MLTEKDRRVQKPKRTTLAQRSIFKIFRFAQDDKHPFIPTY